jgi:hypothetical protein
LYLFKENINAVIEELGWFYVPKPMQPGPAFVFPIRDVDGESKYAQTKPLQGSALGEKSKYRFIGVPLLGPAWLEEGGDLEHYLSRDIQKDRADKNDALLNAWGIQHLHFRPEGTADVLFVKITDTDVFVIQSLPHGRGHSDVWVNSVLLEILHDNWPEMATGKVVGLKAESLSTNNRISLRQRNTNFATAVSDGTVYLAPGGGVSSSGRCFFDVRDGDRIFAYLDYWQRLVEANEQEFRSALGISLGEELSIKMMFEDSECWLCDPVRGVRFGITLQQRHNDVA